ncbi:MAG: phytoene desaturase family protein [Coriobacteriales bacterium]|jgi:phytoene dehydrogenase-like protein
MARHYDIVVVGAGNGGLMAATTAAKNGMKTLLIERHNVPGGSATSFVRGRFEFEVSLHEFANIGSRENPGSYRAMFDENGIDVDWRLEDHVFRLVVPSEGIDANMPCGLVPFADEMERQVPGSKGPLMKMFGAVGQSMPAHAYVTSGQAEAEVIKEKYPDYWKMTCMTLQEGLDFFGIPKKAQLIFTTYWSYQGIPASMANFFNYTAMTMAYIIYGPAMPGNRSHGLSMAIEKVAHESGCEIWYDTEVEKIIVRDGKVCGVIARGEEIEAEQVIANMNPNTVFGKMIDPEDAPERQVKMANSRSLGLVLHTAYLGMNKTAEELGLDSYTYFMPPVSDSDKCYELGHELDNDYVILNCMNNALPDFSPEGTSVLFLTGATFGDAWKDVKPEEYRKVKERLAKHMIEVSERVLGIEITPYIEEIEIAGAATFARYLNTPMGTPYGYEVFNNDAFITRNLALAKDRAMPGLRIVGAGSEVQDGYGPTYLSGFRAAKFDIAEINAKKQQTLVQ